MKKILVFLLVLLVALPTSAGVVVEKRPNEKYKVYLDSWDPLELVYAFSITSDNLSPNNGLFIFGGLYPGTDKNLDCKDGNDQVAGNSFRDEWSGIFWSENEDIRYNLRPVLINHYDAILLWFSDSSKYWVDGSGDKYVCSSILSLFRSTDKYDFAPPITYTYIYIYEGDKSDRIEYNIQVGGSGGSGDSVFGDIPFPFTPFIVAFISIFIIRRRFNGMPSL